MDLHCLFFCASGESFRVQFSRWKNLA